jgi:PAS domain S-box-containing protein
LQVGVRRLRNGFSCLAHLQALPFDELKIDRSFVTSMTGQRESRKIVAAIIGLGRSLGLTTLAEGVETKQQADVLLRLGCELGQGWLYGWPVSVDEVRRVIEDAPRATSTLRSGGDQSSFSSLEALPTQRLAQLQATYDGTPVGLCFLDTKLRYTSINKRLAIMHGATVEAHLGRTVKEMIPEWYANYEPYLLRALQGEAIGGVEIARPSLLPGDPDRMILASYQPAWDEAEEVIGVSLAVVDITEHMRVEEAIRVIERQNQESVEMSIEVPWTMDSHGNSLLANARWIQTSGLRKEETGKLLWLEALHAEDIEGAMKSITAALRTDKPIDIEYRVKGIEQDWRWVRARGAARFGPEGEITRWFGNVVDIDERKQIEEALRRNKTALLSTLDVLPAGIVVVGDSNA